MAEILRGYTFDRRVARYRDTTRGQFVSRTRILSLLDTQVANTEQQLGNIVTALHEGNLSPAYAQTLMRDELRRLHLQNAALGAGGTDKLTFREYGRAGQALRQDYQRMQSLVDGIARGDVTLPQALNRVRGYVGSARVGFFEAERNALRNTGKRYEERRRLGAAEHCVDCVTYHGQGWQPLGVLPVPGTGSACRSNCRCSLERREAEK